MHRIAESIVKMTLSAALALAVTAILAHTISVASHPSLARTSTTPVVASSALLA